MNYSDNEKLEEAMNSALQSLDQLEIPEEEISMLEETRRLYQNLERDLQKWEISAKKIDLNNYDFSLKNADLEQNTEPNFRFNCLNRINVYLYKLLTKETELDARDEERRTIQMKVSLAFQIAKKYEIFLTDSQRDVINLRTRTEVDTATNNDWLPIRAPDTMKSPAKDAETSKFYENLSKEMKKKFDDLQRLVFYLNFGQHIDAIKNDKTGALPIDPTVFLFKDKETYESSIASRTAMLAVEQQNFFIDLETLFDWRESAVNQLEDEQLKLLGENEVKEIKKGEIERLKSVKKWIDEQKGEESD